MDETTEAKKPKVVPRPKPRYVRTLMERAISKVPEFDPKSHAVFVNGVRIGEEDLGHIASPFDVVEVSSR